MKTQFRIIPLGTPEGNSQLEADMLQHIASVQESLGTDHTPVFLTRNGTVDAFWKNAAKRAGISLTKIPNPSELNAAGHETGSNLSRDLVIMSDMADLVLAFWDETPDGKENSIWQTLHRCMEKRIPCIWISRKTGKAFWAYQVLYEPYLDSLLKEYCAGFLAQAPWDAEPGGNKLIQKIFLSGSKHYSRMLKKVRVDMVCSNQDDTMLTDSFSMKAAKAEAARKTLLNAYRLYDDRAIRFSKLYRGSVFFRSVLPIFSTIFLAFAFYGDVICNFVFSGLPEKSLQLLSNYVIGIFFLIYGGLVLFSYLLDHPTIQRWHLNFLHNRIIAEILRFYVHILPYGITLPLPRLLSRSGFRNRQQSEFSVIHQLLRQAEQDFPTYREENMPKYLDHLSDYLTNQLDYHRASAERYYKLSRQCSKWAATFSKLGAFIVLARAFVQFMLRVPFGEYVSYGTYANMLAMIIPAIGTYYAGKRSLLGFEDSYAVDQAMQERLEKALKLLDAMRGHDVNYSMMRNLAETVSELILGNVSAWEQEMRKKKASHL